MCSCFPSDTTARHLVNFSTVSLLNIGLCPETDVNQSDFTPTLSFSSSSCLFDGFSRARACRFGPIGERCSMGSVTAASARAAAVFSLFYYYYYYSSTSRIFQYSPFLFALQDISIHIGNRIDYQNGRLQWNVVRSLHFISFNWCKVKKNKQKKNPPSCW